MALRYLPSLASDQTRACLVIAPGTLDTSYP
jgi:hypothetical protein